MSGGDRRAEVGCRSHSSEAAALWTRCFFSCHRALVVAQPSASRQTGVSPAGYITHHCSAVSAALYSAKHRMARPPGYATGAHVLAGCLPDRRSTVPELINAPTLSTDFSKHVSEYVYTGYCTSFALHFYVDCICANIYLIVV